MASAAGKLRLSPRALLDMAVLKRRLTGLPPGTPDTLYVGLTSRCDLACRHCKYRGGPAGPDIPPARLRRLLKEAAAAGIPRVAFFGGEPLLYPGLDAAVRLASRLGLFTQLDTNGQRLGAARAAELAAAGLSLAMISLHSAERSRHDALAGPGSFRKAEAAVAAALGAGLFVHVSSCLFSARPGAAGVRRLLALARRLGAHGARTVMYSPRSGGKAAPSRRLAAALAAAAPDGFSRGCVRPGRRDCAAAAGEILFVDADLSVRSCPYSGRALGRADRGLRRFFGGERTRPGIFPCHAPARVC